MQEYIFAGSKLYFKSNLAQRGGGLSSEGSARLYVIKHDTVSVSQLVWPYTDFNTTVFREKFADYGGAVYIDDDTNSGTCNTFLQNECFFQVVAIYSSYDASLLNGKSEETQSIVFIQNSARFSGSTLYGGLLDRCTVSPFGEVRHADRLYIGTRDEGRSYFDDIAISKYYVFDRYYNYVN